MARKFLTSIDLAKNELQNAVIQNLAANPTSPILGQVYFNTVANEMRIYNGTEFEAIGLNGVTADAAEINILDGALLSTTELNYVKGVTSAIQTQLDTKSTSNNPTFTGTVTLDTGVTLVFEGATANAFELTLTSGDPTADRVVTLPDWTTTLVGRDTTDTLTNKTITSPSVSGLYLSDASIVFEGSTNDNFETTLSVVDPTADRTIYLPNADGTLARLENKLHDFALATASVNLNNQKIINLADPVNPQDAATKAYVDGVTQGLNVHDSVKVATTANLVATYTPGTTGADGGTGVGATLTLTATGALVIDGYTTVLNDRVLVKNQTTQTQNGIYYVSTAGATGVSAVLTRALDADNSVAGDVTSGDFVFVVSGTTQATTGWVQSYDGTATTPPRGIKLGTDNIAFTQFSGAGAYTGGGGLTQTGTTFDVGAGLGIIVNPNDVAIDTAVVVRKYAANVGNGSATSFTLTHNLNTRDVIVSIYDNNSPYAEVMADVEHTTTNTITVLFSAAPTTDRYRVVVHA